MELFVLKDDFKRLVTGAVAIPGCPDCDHARGEKILSVDEIEGMVHWFNTNSRQSDLMHTYGSTEKVIGDTVENWTLKEPMTVKNIDGKRRTYPAGTWMATTKVTDEETWQLIQDGVIKGYSATYMSRSNAEEFMASKRTLIADLEDPVPVLVSLVDQPCVEDAIFCSIKKDGPVEWGTGDPEAMMVIDDGIHITEDVAKAGRKISNATLKKIQDAFDNIKTLINDALTERGVETEGSNKDLMEDIPMDEKQLKELVREAVKAELELQQEEQAEPEEDEVEEVEEEVEETEPEADPEPTEAEKQLAEAQLRIKELEKQVAKSKGLRGQDDIPEPKSDKRRIEEGRDVRGRRIKA